LSASIALFERVAAFPYFFITLLAGVHLVLMLQTGQSARELAAAGEGADILGEWYLAL